MYMGLMVLCFSHTYIHAYMDNTHTYIHTAECEKLTKQREKLKTTAPQKGSWPANRKDLIREYYRDFVKFVNEIPFDQLNAE